MAEAALVVELTLLERTLRLLSGLESEPSKLGTLRMVADLAMACFAGLLAGRAVVILFIVPVDAGVSVLVDGASSCVSLCAVFEAAIDQA
jgi:hypothetical protein